jgi:hypothetical protein
VLGHVVPSSLWGTGAIPRCHGALVLVFVIVSALLLVGGHPRHHSTHNPPHEQWLMRLGAGGVSFLHRHRRSSLLCRRPPPLIVVCRHELVSNNKIKRERKEIYIRPKKHQRFLGPPHSVILTSSLRVGGVVVTLPPSLLLPVPTPRAVARSGGWGCCGGGRHCGLLLPVVRRSPSCPC